MIDLRIKYKMDSGFYPVYKAERYNIYEGFTQNHLKQEYIAWLEGEHCKFSSFRMRYKKNTGNSAVFLDNGNEIYTQQYGSWLEDIYNELHKAIS